MTARPLTAKQVRKIAYAYGWWHAEFCVEQEERKFGTEKLAAARVELERIFKEMAKEGDLK